MGNLTHWTEFSVAKLRKLLDKNYTSSQIAAQLGPDFTRNAVIGKIHRMGWAKKPAPLVVKKEKKAAVVTFVPKAELPEVPQKKNKLASEFLPVKTDTSNIVSFMKLKAKMCRYPVSGQGFGTLFCGNPTDEDRSWCGDHRRVVYISRSESKRHGEEVEVREKPTRLLSNTPRGGFNFANPPK